MTPEEQRELVKKHYALNAAGDYPAAQELLTDDFFLTIPDYMPFAGVYRGKGALRELIPIVAEAAAVTAMKPVATTVGDGYAVELVEFTLAGEDGPPMQVAEVIRFRGNQICEIRPFYFDPAPMMRKRQSKQAPASEKVNSIMSEHDKAAIIEVLNLYGFALDAHQWDLFDHVFAEDVTADFGPAGAEWSGLENFKRSFAEFHNTLDNHQHTMMGHLVHVDGDKAHAFSYGTWLLVREAAKGGPTWTGNGWYDDELIRTEHGWRIQRRVCRLVSWTGNPLVPEPNQEHNPDMKTNVLRRHSEDGKIGYLRAIQRTRENCW